VLIHSRRTRIGDVRNRDDDGGVNRMTSAPEAAERSADPVSTGSAEPATTPIALDQVQELLDSAASSALSRRRLMRGAAIAGATVAVGAGLAACGSSGSSSSSSGGSGSPDLGATSDIPVGGGKIFADQKVVVTQPVAGTYKAFSSTCTHLGCTVNQISGGLIHCPCHGSEYSITDGSVKGGPAPKPLPPENISVKNNQITLDS
jgi:Rieske Fe-S protein